MTDSRRVLVGEAGNIIAAAVMLPLVIAIAVAAYIYFSAEQQTVPVTGRTQHVALSEADQAKLGAQAYQQILQEARSSVVEDGAEAEMVRRVGERLAKVSDDPGFDWQFTLINSAEVNAFCLPGGKVVVYSGILPVTQSETGLAVVTAHEIGHAIAQHGAERMLQDEIARVGLTGVSAALGSQDGATRGAVLALFGAGAEYGVLLPFSRDMESEADHIGLIYMARAGYDPNEAIALWQRMKAQDKGGSAPEYMSTHPSDATRIKDLQKWLPEALKEYEKATAGP